MSSRMHRRPVRINLADTPRRNDNGHAPFDKLDRLVSRPQRCTVRGNRLMRAAADAAED